jgi:hypothetical protein
MSRLQDCVPGSSLYIEPERLVEVGQDNGWVSGPPHLEVAQGASLKHLVYGGLREIADLIGQETGHGGQFR